ncbi:DUF4277 domain-containing protein [Paenibacillus sp. YYML68]|uniref:DUF4277 domain-containing protein n=1 Tax=Paenibacillus sp. YYML68 TaxID=2909250 RepID=UPI00248F5200|nr:DUF4277 domain-containing protein [Paenibacillus sp. YYML68]
MSLLIRSSVLLDRMSKEIEFEPTINRLLSWDEKRCKLSPGTRLKALVINVMTGRDPLCHVDQFYRDQDVGLLFGEEVTADDLNDDALARELRHDNIYCERCQIRKPLSKYTTSLYALCRRW